MRKFSTIAVVVGKGPGIAPLYEPLGPLEREECTDSEAEWIDGLLDKIGFNEMSTATFAAFGQDIPLTSVTANWIDGERHTVRFAPKTLGKELDDLLDFIRAKCPKSDED